MTLWRVDFKVKSDLVLAKDEKDVHFTAPDNSYEIYLFTKRGPGQHAADELYLSAHVLLQDDDAQHAADEAEVHLRRFLDILAIVTNSYYAIRDRTMVVDWTPGLNKRHLLSFRQFPNPHVPLYALKQAQLETVKKLMAKPIPRDVRLAIRWWARGLSADAASDQFQFLWYALEILAEHVKPTNKVASKCPKCQGDLLCTTCNAVPLHRPHPKQAIKMLVDKHVKGQPDKFFELIDEARNRLLHGEDPAAIEQDLKVGWTTISDALGKATWTALLSNLVNDATSGGVGKLDLIQASTFMHYDAVAVANITAGANHADPANPRIEEFQPDFTINMNVMEGSGGSTTAHKDPLRG